jgi:hypothetical protein
MRKSTEEERALPADKKKRPGESETNPAPESVGEFWSKHTDVRERERD